MKKNTLNIQRCSWVPDNKPEYIQYHDIEWGVPVFDDKIHFEFLILEGAQAGLSWETILKRRKEYKKVFANFDPKRVAEFCNGSSDIDNKISDDCKKVQELLKNSGIIRNKLKVKSAINNARRFLEVQKEFGTFSKYAWQFVAEKPIINSWKSMSEVPAKTTQSENFSKDLKKRGFNFVGPTIMYAYMQATGMVNDHSVDCFRYKNMSHFPSVTSS